MFPSYTETVSKLSPQWSDAQMKQHKRAQAKISMAGATTGLLGLGALTGGKGLRSASKLKRLNPTTAKRLRRVGHHVGQATVPLSAVTGGIGGVGGYNFAAIQSQEARKRTPMGKAFNAERSRRKRGRFYESATGAAGVAGLGAGSAFGSMAARQQRSLSGLRDKVASTGRTFSRVKHLDVANPKHVRAAQNNTAAKEALATAIRGRNKNLKVTGGLAALGAGGLIASNRIRSYNRTKGKSYSPRYSPR